MLLRNFLHSPANFASVVVKVFYFHMFIIVSTGFVFGFWCRVQSRLRFSVQINHSTRALAAQEICDIVPLVSHCNLKCSLTSTIYDGLRDVARNFSDVFRHLLISRINVATFFKKQTNYGQILASENNAWVVVASTGTAVRTVHE